MSKARSRFPGAYPESLVGADNGPMVYDARGKTYTDWICALGAISLGYHDHGVDTAVMDQVKKGPIFSLSNVELEEAVAEALCEAIPCAEVVRFLKTGSEATEAAIRVARAYTGREVIVQCGYHSWHSWYAATREEAPGVPLAMRGLVRSFQYNDVDSLRRVFDELPAGSVAAVIMEPTLFEAPSPMFLQEVKLRCRYHGALLIFDETVTGFRWHRGGYQAVCGITPDLATFGKGMGNGYPIAALVGRADIMKHARLASGTFGGDCIGLAAAGAVLDRYKQNDVCEHMREIGLALMKGYNALAWSFDLPTSMYGQPYHPGFRWAEETSGGPNTYRVSLFFQEVVKRGVLFHPGGVNIMRAHDAGHLTQALDAIREAMIVVRNAMRAGTVADKIEGSHISTAPAWRVVQ